MAYIQRTFAPEMCTQPYRDIRGLKDIKELCTYRSEHRDARDIFSLCL